MLLFFFFLPFGSCAHRSVSGGRRAAACHSSSKVGEELEELVGAKRKEMSPPFSQIMTDVGGQGKKKRSAAAG